MPPDMCAPYDDPGALLREALIDSRQRWRSLVSISSDIAFETDAEGRLVFLSPEHIIGWDAETLLGSMAETLLVDGGDGFNPFTTRQDLRNRRVWLRRPDGGASWISFTAAPLHDAQGTYRGVRGAGRDVTELDRSEAAMARALRRSGLIDHIVWHMRTEIMAPRMMVRALHALTGTLGAQGAMIVEVAEQDPHAQDHLAPLHEVGGDRPALRRLVAARLAEGASGPLLLHGPDGEAAMLCETSTRFESCAGVVVWRRPGLREWDGDDLSLLAAVSGTLRIVLEHGAIQREMARQARTDALTGLANRRAFNEDLARRIDRLERERLPGSLLFIDLDNFKLVNDSRGHAVGDEALVIIAGLLRAASRPTDLIARLGGDEFAVWLDGMDELAAAERGSMLCAQGAAALAGLSDRHPSAGLSIGVAGRWPGSDLDGETLLRRSDHAMYRVKHDGRGRCHIWQAEDGDVC